VLSEVYAKLIAAVVQHWVLVAGCWEESRRGLTKAAKVVRQQALSLAAAVADLGPLLQALALTVRCLAAGSRTHRSRKDPRTWQLLDLKDHCGVPLS
jgi:outer membrane murein-binding lipoprotein Lpp